MKLRLRFNKEHKTIQLWKEQFNMIELEKKVKTSYDIKDRFILLYYKDRDNSNVMLIKDEDIKNMELEMAEAVQQDGIRRAYPEIRILTLKSFLTKNAHFAIKSILKDYFFQKVQISTNVDLLKWELIHIQRELQENNVCQKIITEISQYLIREFLSTCKHEKFDESSNKSSNELSPSFVNDDADISSISSISESLPFCQSFMTVGNTSINRRPVAKSPQKNEMLDVVSEKSESDNECQSKRNLDCQQPGINSVNITKSQNVHAAKASIIRPNKRMSLGDVFTFFK